MIYYIDGLRHDCFVEAENPQDAINKAKEFVDPSWESPSVYRAEWIENVLRPVGMPVYQQVDYNGGE